MPKISILFFLLLWLSISKGLSQDYMNDILDKTCACVDNLKDTTDTGRYHMSIGSCLITSSMPYKKELKKDYQIDLNDIEKNAGKLGQMVALKMGTYCPKVLYKLTNMFNADKIKNQSYNITGIVSKIENELFVIISVTEDNGKSTKLYWLSLLESKTDITHKYKTLIGKHVNITYRQEEFFDPNIEEYRLYNVIKKIDYL